MNIVIPGVGGQLRRVADALEDLVKLLEASRSGRLGRLGLKTLAEEENSPEDDQTIFYHDRLAIEEEEKREEEQRNLRLFGRKDGPKRT